MGTFRYFFRDICRLAQAGSGTCAETVRVPSDRMHSCPPLSITLTHCNAGRHPSAALQQDLVSSKSHRFGDQVHHSSVAELTATDSGVSATAPSTAARAVERHLGYATCGCRQDASDVRISIGGSGGAAAEGSALQRGCGAARGAVCAQGRWLRPVLQGLAGWHVAVQAWRLLQDTVAACRSGEWRAALECALRQPLCCYCVGACPACFIALQQGMQFPCRRRSCTIVS